MGERRLGDVGRAAFVLRLRRGALASAALATALLCVVGPAPVASAKDSPAERYAKDVEFLLEHLEEKAGHFFAQKKVDWKKVSKQFRAEVKSVLNDGDHLRLCARLVARLRDGHAGLVDLKVPWPEEPGARDRTGPGVHLLTVGDAVHVRAAFGAAVEEGVKVGAEVVRIDGVPARKWLDAKAAELADLRGFSTDGHALHSACHHGLLGPKDGAVVFDLRGGGSPRQAKVRRGEGGSTVPIGPVFPPEGLQRIGRQSYGKTEAGNGYVHLRDVPDDLPAQLDTMLAAIGDVPGFVLDMRANGGGGCDHEATFGRFVTAGTKWRQYASGGPRPYSGPMVVIVDAGTVSAGETVSGMFKEDGRAYLIGDSPTAGMSSSKERVAVPSGLFSVHFSVASNKKRFNGGRGIEGIGVPPHEVVSYDPKDLQGGVDTQIRRAEELLKAGLPKGKVAWRVPGK
jgi:carboxyl-terminal processing protease